MDSALAVKPEITELKDEEISVGPYRQWNPSAVACFVRNADCNGCFYKNFFTDKPYDCHMNQAVQHLLKKVGPPDKRRLERLASI